MTINDLSIDGVLGTRTWGSRMEIADESTELWRPAKMHLFHYLFLGSVVTILQSIDAINLNLTRQRENVAAAHQRKKKYILGKLTKCFRQRKV